MKKVYIVWVFIAEIDDQILYAVCGNDDALKKCKAELLNEGYTEKDIRVGDMLLRN